MEKTGHLREESIFSTACTIGLYTHQWTIKNYSLVKYSSQKITSAVFVVGQNSGNELQLHLTPRNDNNFKIEIFLDRISCLDTPYFTYFKSDLNLEFLDNNGKILDYFIGLPCELKETSQQTHESKRCYWKKDDDASRLIENDSLKIRIKLSLKYFREFKPDETLFSKSVEKLSSDLKHLAGGDNIFSDLFIKVAGQCFFGHKGILLPQLSYIKKLNSKLSDDDETISTNRAIMNITDNLNKNVDAICIPNENAEIFQSVLHYLYTGKLFLRDNSNPFSLYEFAQRNELYELCMNLRPTEMYSCTRPKSLKTSFYWYVKEFSVKSLEKFNHYRSPAYRVSVTENISWCLSLFFFEPQCIFLSLQREEGIDKDVTAAFKLIVCNPDGTSYVEREFKYHFASKMPTSYPRFLDPESRFTIVPTLLYDDTLTLRCSLEIFDGQLMTDVRLVHRGEISKFDFKIWVKNLQNLLDTGRFSDVSLMVDDTEFKVHKAILSARSAVFSRMFETNMSERLNSSVKIEDISSFTMKCALTYIYTGRLDVLTMSEAPELYRAADKYEIFDLKDRCKEFIAANLDAESASEVLILADLYNEKEMKEAAKNCICRNASQAFLTDCGQDLMVNQPHLAEDILDRLSAAFCTLPIQDVYRFEYKNSLTDKSAELETSKNDALAPNIK